LRKQTILGLVAGAVALLAIVALARPHITTAGPPPNFGVHDPLAQGGKRLTAVPGQVIVKFKPGVSEASRSAVVKTQGGALGAPLRVPNYFVVTVKETDKDTVPRIAAALAKDPSVASAQPNYYRYADLTPNDPYYPYQWNLPKIQMPSAWDLTAGTGITVAIVDTGVAYEDYGQYKRAPDLVGTTFVAGWNFINGTAHANDDNAHGTHVAGTIAQSTNNAVGVAGVAYKARIMPLKALNAEGVGQDDWVASAIVWAADNGAKVINLSLGADSPAAILEDAVNYAYDKGCVVVAAAGNTGAPTLSYPAGFPNVISVGAVRYDETRAAYASYGAGLTVVAPGGDLGADQNNDGYPDGILQQTFNPTTKDPADFGYWFLQGTSMATPHVSGIAALLLAQGTATTPQQVKMALQQTAKDKGAAGPDAEYGYGLVQARSALDWVAPPPTSTPTITPTPTVTSTPTQTPTPTVAPPSPLTITGVVFSPVNLPSGSLLRVDIGVRNDSGAPALTQGPDPGFIFTEGDTVDSRGYPDVPGRWRVGVEYGARLGGKDHPYRWGLGGQLNSGASVTVTGYIFLKTQRTTNYWVGLVHERVQWWQDNRGNTSITVGPPEFVSDLRFAGATATRYAYVYQCTADAVLQRVWRVDYGRVSASYQYTQVRSPSTSCGAWNAVFGQYQLTISGGTMTPFGWATQCAGSGNVRRVWRANADGRNIPFAYPELTASCP